MSALTCRDFFAWNAGNSDLVKELQKHSSDALSWEANTASDHSPGPVEQDETLFRQIVQPLHIDMETRTLRPNAFNDVANKGLSVDRAKHSSVAEIISSGRKRVAARAASDGRALYALAEFRSLALNSANSLSQAEPCAGRTGRISRRRLFFPFRTRLSALPDLRDTRCVLQGRDLVFLFPELSRIFPTTEAINSALNGLRAIDTRLEIPTLPSCRETAHHRCGNVPCR